MYMYMYMFMCRDLAAPLMWPSTYHEFFNSIDLAYVYNVGPKVNLASTILMDELMFQANIMY